jgi:hypothetical protein
VELVDGARRERKQDGQGQGDVGPGHHDRAAIVPARVGINQLLEKYRRRLVTTTVGRRPAGSKEPA